MKEGLYILKKVFSTIKKYFKGWFEKRIVWSLIAAGVAILLAAFTQPWWQEIVIALLNKYLHLNIEDSNVKVNYFLLLLASVVAFTLIRTGVWFHFKTKEKVTKKTMVQICHSSIESVGYSKIDKDLTDYVVEPYHLNQVEELKKPNEPNLKHALREQEKFVQKVLNRIGGSSDVDLAFLGLAHIPLMVLLGFQLANKASAMFFEWNQNELLWEEIEDSIVENQPLLLDKSIHKQDTQITKDVIIKIGVTYPIEDWQLSGLNLENLNSYYLHLEVPERNAVTNVKQLNQYQQKFRGLLDEINQTYPLLERVHLFYSGQPSLAYRLGSAITSRMDKEMWVYNYIASSSPKYPWAINLRKDGQPVSLKFTGETVHV
jgi:hypothetical protein